MDSEAFVRRAFPSRIADLGFSVELPDGWQPQALPEETPDFEDGTRLFGLGAATAPYAALVFAAAARPAFADGTVLDWARWLVEQNGVELRAFGPSQLGELPAIVGQCAAPSDLGEMRTHFAFAEDGQRLIHVSVTGPAALASHVWQVWAQVQRSFALDTPRGPSAALAPAAQVHQPSASVDTTVADVGQFALEGGRATLAQDHPLNHRWLEQGQGFSPRIRAADEAGGKAWVASIALRAVLELPFGWHPLDDGRRLVLLQPDNAVQISLERLALPEGGLPALLDALEAQVRADHPAPQCLRLQSGPVLGLAVRGIADGEQPLEQVHLLLAGPDDGEALRARVTALPGQISRAADLGEALLYSVRVEADDGPPPEADADASQPAWACQAYALEAADRLDEAEQAMLEGCDQLGVLMSIAVMYGARMRRLAAAGDATGAAEARARAQRWAWQYAAGATSGGEGVALSRERDAFIASLGGE
ncbi:MAG: hypothetical protein HY855_20220 [Burkholderiales bacterium]|nr:hypothetical protein [Burkholderiales bacterium]